MSKVVLSSKEAEFLNSYFRASGASLTSYACSYEQYNLAISILRKFVYNF